MTAADDKIAETLACPTCGAALGLETVTKLMNESRVSFVITPHPGEFLQAKTVGGTIAEFAKILTAEDADLGVTTTVVVESVSSSDGEVTVRFLLCRHKPEIGDR